MLTQHRCKLSRNNLLRAALIGIFLAMSTPSHAACNEETLVCKNVTISDLIQQIERLEIDNAKMRYDVEDLRDKLKVTDRELSLCMVNLKNITVEMRTCGK